MNKLTKEILERKNRNNITDNIIGSEIKIQRIKLEQTIEAICRGICSVSYGCKIERNNIKPNPVYVREICHRVNISDEKLESLYNLEKYLEQILVDFYYDNKEGIINIYNKISSFDNYRALLLKFAYHVYFNNFLSAKKLDNDLNKLIPNMDDRDISIYAVIKSIFDIKNFKYEYASEVLKVLLEYKLIKEEEKGLILEYIVKMYLNINSIAFLTYVDDSISTHNSLMNYKKARDTLFFKGLYYYINNLNREFDEILNKKYEEKHINTLMLLKDIKEKNIENITKKEYYNDFFSLLAWHYYDKEGFIKSLNNDQIYNLSDIEMLILRYLLLDVNSSDYLVELSVNYYPTALALNNTYVINLMTEALIERLQCLSKYKKALEVVLKSNNITKGLLKL